MGKWDHARNKPVWLKELQPAGRLIYRIRNLTLILNGDRRAELCGGIELWWQNILNEQLLAMLTGQLVPSLMPELKGDPPKKRAGCEWWMRRGVNPCNPAIEPATWALVEAAQERVFPSRGVCHSPAVFKPLPQWALNGDMGVPRRQNFLAKLIGSDKGFSVRASSEFYSDWSSMLKAWKALGSSSRSARQQRPLVHDSQLYDQVADAIQFELLPGVLESIKSIETSLNLNNPK
jgi:hypothetical protein